MKRLFYIAAGLATLALISILFFPSIPSRVVDLAPASLPTPSVGFDVRREGTPHGSMETIEYDSQAAGGKRKMCVYTPPGFSTDQKLSRGA